jgi:signal peptidase I
MADDAHSVSRKEREPDKNIGSFKETFATVSMAILIALGVRTFAYEPFNIPSGSMIPTLLVGDYLFVSKASYGYSRHSLPFSLPLIPGRIFFEEPKRGDVMVFKLPTDNKTDYIKRIVGLPGDLIQLKDSVLFINNRAIKRERIKDFIELAGPNVYSRTPRYRETFPEGHYFAMGDNRDRSRDSRFLNDVGYIPRKNLVGRAEFLFFSVDGAAWKFWNWSKSLRLERFFQGIE